MTDLRLEGVGFTYDSGVRALDAIDLEVRAGETVAIVGQNGSGKSTLIRHLNGLLRPGEGRMLHDGRDIRRERVAALAATVGIVFQNPDRQIFARRVHDEIAFGPQMLGRRGAEVDEAVRAALEAVGLATDAEANPYDLGWSRRKLLALAAVLAMRTPVLVLDEPTTGQDLRGVRRVGDIVAAVAREGRTIIAVSHDIRWVAETFSRVVVMRAGRIILDGPPRDVFAEAAWPALRSTFVEPPLAALEGARLGLGSTPTEASLVAALASR